MKHFIYNGETTDTLPGIITLADGSQLSPVTETSFVANGGIITEDGEPTHFDELCTSCDTFIEVVLEIAEKIGDPTFMGGINQQSMLRDSQYAKDHPTEALTLAERWNGADKACNFYADKPDLIATYHSPVWFYFAWERWAESQKPTQVVEAQSEEPESPAEDPAPEAESESAE